MRRANRRETTLPECLPAENLFDNGKSYEELRRRGIQNPIRAEGHGTFLLTERKKGANTRKSKLARGLNTSLGFKPPGKTTEGAPFGSSKIEPGGLGVWCEPDFRCPGRVAVCFFTNRPEMHSLRR